MSIALAASAPASSWRRHRFGLAALALPPAWAHAVRTVLAAMLALWLAFELKLDTPYSAATTVLIVSHPVHGMILSKSLYRFGGTLVGAAVAMALMAAFAQVPELFILALSLWMGLCTAASTLLRNFRSYGAVLAGYTVVLIAMPAVDRPDSIFDLAMARVAVVSLGIACSAVVASLLTGHSAEPSLESRWRGLLAGLAAYCRLSLSGAAAAEMTDLRRTLAPQIGGLDALVQFAALETAAIGPLADGLRGAITAMFGTLSAAASLHGALGRDSPSPRLATMVGEAAALIDALIDALAKGDLAVLEGFSAALAGLGRRIEAALDPRDRPALIALDRLGEVLDELDLCVEGLNRLLGPRAGRRPAAMPPPLDLRWALSNGARAAVAVWLTGALWVVTGWPAGATMVAGVVPNVGLLSLRDRPAADAIGFAWGTALASAIGFLCLIRWLPESTGFPMLAAIMAPLLLFGVMAASVPRLTFFGLGFCVFFITLLAPTNPMRYDPELFLNNALATVAGGILTAAVYNLVLPVNAKARRRALVQAILGDLRTLLRSPRPLRRAEWEARMHDRLLLLGARLRAAGIHADAALRGGFAGLRVGREALRLRDLPIPPEARQLAAATLAGIVARPHQAARDCHRAADRMLVLAEPLAQGDAAALGRAAASLLEIALLIGRHRRFFQLISRG